MAAAAPLAAMVGNVPLALRLTDAPGLPGAFVLATIVLLCFSVGYGAMSRRVVNTGAFYTYVARGLGKPPAVAVALVAVLSYNAMAIGLTGGFGYFAQRGPARGRHRRELAPAGRRRLGHHRVPRLPVGGAQRQGARGAR